MRYMVTAHTDVGIEKSTNQDSVLIKHGKCEKGEVLLCIVCDGMGGLAKGEVASAAVVRKFSEWFDEELPFELESADGRVIGGKWSLLLKELNVKIAEYGQQAGVRMGTTFTGVLFFKDEYVAVHIGDTRLYRLDSSLRQMTTDQTFVAREMNRGTLTPEQSKTDKRRNMLLQCIGASERIDPEILTGKVEKGAYMLCTDGFRHEISDTEIFKALNPRKLSDRDVMHARVRKLIEEVKNRQEKDNISVVMIKAS